MVDHGLSWSATLWLISFLLAGVLSFIALYRWMILNDWAGDRMNERDFEDGWIRIVMLEYNVHFALCVVIALNRSWILLAIEVPLMAYMIYKYALKKHRIQDFSRSRDVSRLWPYVYAAAVSYMLCLLWCIFAGMTEVVFYIIRHHEIGFGFLHHLSKLRFAGPQ